MKERLLNMFCEISLSDKIIGISGLLYIIAFVLMSKGFEIENVELAFLLLIILAVAAIIYKMFAMPSDAIKISISATTIIIALAVAGRYFSYFITDLKYISVLLLFVSSIGFVVGAIMSIAHLKKLIMERKREISASKEEGESEAT